MPALRNVNQGRCSAGRSGQGQHRGWPPPRPNTGELFFSPLVPFFSSSVVSLLWTSANMRVHCNSHGLTATCVFVCVIRGYHCVKAGDQGIPDAHQPDPAPHPAAALGQPPGCALHGGWPAALWHHLRRALLRHDLHLAGAQLYPPQPLKSAKKSWVPSGRWAGQPIPSLGKRQKSWMPYGRVQNSELGQCMQNPGHVRSHLRPPCVSPAPVLCAL